MINRKKKEKNNKLGLPKENRHWHNSRRLVLIYIYIYIYFS